MFINLKAIDDTLGVTNRPVFITTHQTVELTPLYVLQSSSKNLREKDKTETMN